jgi:Flp pilus assembly pilin Flp
MKRLMRKINRRSAQSLVEYALILALIAVVAVAVLRGVGRSVNQKLTGVNTNLQ